MRTRKLGKTDIEIGVIGYGAMSLSLQAMPEETAFQLLHAVWSQGASLVDTADCYCIDENDQHHNERLIVRALAAYSGDRSRICIATKGGAVKIDGRWKLAGTPEALYRTICESCETLGGPIPLWQHHWPSPEYSVAESMRPVRRAVDEKMILHVGVSNYSIAQIREAQELVEIVSVQNEYNLWRRDPETNGVLEYCEQQDLVFLPWRPMGGKGLAQRLGEIKPLENLVRERGVSPHRLLLAWLMAKSKCVVPIPGSSRLENALDALAAADLRLTAQEMQAIDGIRVDELPGSERARSGNTFQRSQLR